MNQDIVLFTVRSAIRDLHQYDSKFLNRRYDIHERTVTHRLAMYLQKYFSEYDVDVEYNRMRKADDYGNTDIKDLSKKINWVEWATRHEPSYVYPDIIVHQRDTRENLLIIEVKMYWNQSEKEDDFKKIYAYKQDLEYKYGFYLELNEEGYILACNDFGPDVRPDEKSFLYTTSLCF